MLIQDSEQCLVRGHCTKYLLDKLLSEQRVELPTGRTRMGLTLALPVWATCLGHMAKQGLLPHSPSHHPRAVPEGSWKDGSLTCREEVLLTGSGTGARRLGGFFL